MVSENTSKETMIKSCLLDNVLEFRGQGVFHAILSIPAALHHHLKPEPKAGEMKGENPVDLSCIFGLGLLGPVV